MLCIAQTYLYPMKALWTLNPYFWRYKWLLLSGVFFVLLSAAFSVFPAVYIREAFDEVAWAISGQGSPDSQRSMGLRNALMIYSALILGLSVLKGLFTFLMRQTLIVMSRHIEFDLKNDIYTHYQKLDMGFYRRNSTGDLMNRISEDVGRTRMYIGPALMYTINTAFATGITLYFMFSVDVRLSLMTLAPMPLLVWCIYRVSTLINQRSHAVQAQQSAISTLAQETFSGLRVLKAFGLEAEQTQRYATSAGQTFVQNERLYRVNALFMPLMLLLVGTSTLIAVWVGGQGVIEGRLSPGVIAEFVYYVNLLTWPIASIGWVMSMVQRAEASMQRINDFLHIQPVIQNPKSPYSSENYRGEIVFENVSYTYPDSGIKALSEFSAHISPGETIVVVGKTGSGKTTLGLLLNRVMDPQSGRILVDGVDIRQWDVQALRRAIGTVPQDAFLFSDTIAENIAFGTVDASRGEVEEYAELAHVAEDVRGFPLGFDTVVGERGISLSGGQKQRVSIARALIKKPPMLLLDDALSAVDTDTEVNILSELREKLHGVTAVLITQRLSCVHLADRIYVLEDGRMTQEGTHQSLVQVPGVYAELYALQNPDSWTAA